MVGAKPFEQFIRKASAEFFSLISDNVMGGPKTAVPFVKNGISNSFGFFVWWGHQFDIFCQRFSHAQNKLFTNVTGFKGPKEIGMNALVGLGRLWQTGEQGRWRTVSCAAQLTSVQD